MSDCENPSLPQPPSQRLAQSEEEDEGQVEEVDDLLISVYPNPNDGNLNILITATEEESYGLQILNLLGEQVFESDLSPGVNSLQLPVAAGSYLYNVHSYDGKSVSKGRLVVLEE